MIQKLSEGVLKLYKERGIDPYELVENSFVTNLVAYIIDSKYRRAITLKTWLTQQLEDNVDLIRSLARKIPSYDDNDKQIVEILRWVRSYLTYTSDTKVYQKLEYWATVPDMVANRRGDCEDFSILTYSLARFKGIKSNRLYLWTGIAQSAPDGRTIGHLSLFYKPNGYPFNYVTMDGTYYPTNKQVHLRNLVWFKEKEIIEYRRDGERVWSYYRNTWFIFNEDKSFSKMRLKKLGGTL